ncbi:hypothetical protein ABK040_014079 [Willaertia magna]
MSDNNTNNNATTVGSVTSTDTPHYVSKYSSLNGFGLKILSKYGFQVGEGLGKNKDGLKNALNQTSKKYSENKVGIGADKKKENYWWERSYDDMLSNVRSKISNNSLESSSDSDSSEEEEENKKKRKIEKEIKTEKKEKTKEKNKKVKKSSSVATSSSSDRSSDDSDSESDSNKKITKKSTTIAPEGSKVLTHSCFEACEGRTLKKVKQVGKATRAKNSEQELIEKLKEAKEKMEKFNEERKFRNVVTEKRKIANARVKITKSNE